MEKFTLLGQDFKHPMQDCKRVAGPPLSTLRSTPSLVNFVPLLNKENGRPTMVKRKLDGAVDKSSSDQEIPKSNAIVHNLLKIWRSAPSRTGSYGRLSLPDKI